MCGVGFKGEECEGGEIEGVGYRWECWGKGVRECWEIEGKGG